MSDGMVQVRYFALLREQRGAASDEVPATGETAAQLYARLAAAHRFTLTAGQIRVAVNDRFVPPEQMLQAGDTVVFVPPVAGG